MNRLGVYLCLLMLLASVQPLLAQTPINNQRCIMVPITADAHLLDTLTVLPATITIFHPKKEQFSFEYSYNTRQFRFTKFPITDSTAIDSTGNRQVMRDSVLICYRVLPLNLTKPAFRRDIDKLDMASFKKEYYQEEIGIREEIFRTPGLNKTGSISRGISFGNTQNVFVNSSLNLQLDGKLTDDISITAAITDQNIPFQPEGNTQQLQDFDRVYITLKHKLWQLTAGDVILRNKPSYFLQYYKNVQGAAFETLFGKNEGNQGTTTVAAAVSKGKFASQIVEPQEGVLGPYRLRGPNNERFIIVLANSERVFLDGRLLVRGFDYDYTIDYNQAEISFTTRQVITRNSRIRVDFEYADQNYSRSVYNLSHYQQLGKLGLYANYYNEADNPNSLVNLDLRDGEKRILASIGDNLSEAVIPGADSVSFDPTQVLYAKRDTLYSNGQRAATIYQYSTDPERAHFNVRFSEVGLNKGDYVVSNTTINGRVYKWIAPVNDIPQGNYAPIRIIPTPRKKQLINLGATYEVQKGIKFFIETAASENDINRFSKLDAADNDGKALRVGYVVEDRELLFFKNYKFNSVLNYEYTTVDFQSIDRYRPIEFDRDWSLQDLTAKAEDHIFNFSVGVVKDNANLYNYRISRRYREEQLDGLQHQLDVFRKFGQLELRNSFFLLNSEQIASSSDWYRGDLGVKYNFRFFAPGYIYRFDKNKIVHNDTDKIIGSAQYFDEHLFFVENTDSALTRFRLDYSYRTDLRPTAQGTLGLPEQGQTVNGFLQKSLGSDNDLSVQGTYRRLDLPSNQREETVQARLDWNAGFLDGSFRSELTYAVGTGRELKRIFIFRETLPGQGTHYLRAGGDLNDLNDYLEAQTVDQQRYIKIFLPTDEYVNAYMNQFLYRLNSNTPRSWRTKEGFKGFASKFSVLTFISIDKKTTDNNLMNRFNPFRDDFEDDFLLSLNKSLRNTVYFNRTSPLYGIEYNFQQNQQKSLLANGTETRNLGSHVFIGRINLNEVLSSRLTTGVLVRENSSNFLASKNFRIRSRELSPELAYQPNTKLRFTGTYQFSLRDNTEAPEAQSTEATFHELGVETRLSQVSKRSVAANIKYVKIVFEGEQNSFVGYEILNALRPGNNMTWSLNVQQRLSNGLNISVNYDGRKAKGINAVHTGRTQVSVLF